MSHFREISIQCCLNYGSVYYQHKTTINSIPGGASPNVVRLCVRVLQAPLPHVSDALRACEIEQSCLKIHIFHCLAFQFLLFDKTDYSKYAGKF